jgi:hypothetical protein
MDEAAATGVNADVVYMAAVNTEKDEIAGGEGIQCHRMCRALLRVGRARNLHTRALVDVHGEAATVETLQIRATEVVGGTDELRGRARDRRATVAGWLGLARDTAAGDEKQG